MVLTLLCNNVIQIFAADRHDRRHMLGLCCHRCCVVPSANRVTICLDARLGCFCADSSLQRASARVKSTHVSLRNVAKKKPIVDGVPPTDGRDNQRGAAATCVQLSRISQHPHLWDALRLLLSLSLHGDYDATDTSKPHRQTDIHPLHTRAFGLSTLARAVFQPQDTRLTQGLTGP